MKKLLLSFVLGITGLMFANQANAQCTPTNCLSSLPAYGGICDTILMTGTVGTPYSDFESFHLTTACFDAGLIDPGNAGTGIKITNIDNFTYTGLPGGLSAAANQASFTAPANGCIAVSGTPTTAGVFAVTANFLADVQAWPFGGGACSGFNISQNNNAADYALELVILPNPNFTIPKTTFCDNEPAVALSLAANATTGGTFSGPGVSAATFNPATAGIGTHTIRYIVSAQQGAAIAPATDSFSITVTVSPAVAANTVETDVTCAAGGTATTTVTTGTAPYNYSWNTGATTSSISGLTAGNYAVTVSDANGCAVTNTVTIASNVVTINTNTPTTTPSDCGLATGSASVNPVNGTAPYTYTWNNGGSTQTINNIASGSYSVTIIDANSCQGVVSNIVVSNPNSPTATIASSSNNDCNGETNGDASVTAAGGTVTTGYTYNWSNGANTSSVNGLAAGVYTVTVTDNASCLDVASVTITQPTAITISGTATDVQCFGESTGTASVTVSGGTPSYSYAWNNGGNAANLSNLAAGTYTVTVTDNNSCVNTFSLTVTQPAAGLSFNPVSSNILCFGAGNGSAAVNASGGAGVYTYSWSNGSTDPSLSFLQAGTYICTVTDANGCTASPAAFTITEPSVLNVSSTVTNASAFGASDGAVNLNVSGGTGTYTYNWSNGANTQNLSNLSAGEYTVTVTDANGCNFVQSATVDQPSSVPAFNNISDLALYPNPGDNILYIESPILSGVEVFVQIFAVDGKMVKFQTFNNQHNLIEINTSELSSGVYYVNIKTEKGNSSLKWIKK